MAKRKGLSKRTRFEVFKRDCFKCQYCGQASPDVVLEIEHVLPVAKGGTNDILNLVTACEACNSGKSDVLLDDATAVKKSQKQAEQLAERKAQMEMLVQWRSGLLDIDTAAVEQIEEYFGKLTGNVFTDQGRATIRKVYKKFGFDETLVAIDTAVAQYPDLSLAFAKIGAIAHVRRKSKDDPDYEIICIVRGILKSRGLHINYANLDAWIRALSSWEVDSFEINAAAKQARSWTAFIQRLNELQTEARQRMEAQDGQS